MIGADRIRGDFVLLLSSHALVLADTISELRETFEDNPDCGLVGAKIISQTNKVLEAGCRVKNDGTINRLGAGMDPRHPDISFLRQVDFLSAICLMMPKDLFLTFNFEHIMSADSEKMGEQFAQAARKSGLHVFFQPLSQVFLSGSKNNPNPKTFSKNHISNDKNLTREEKAKGQTFGLKTTDFSGNILVLDIWTPTPDQDSGSMDMYSYFKIFISLGYQVTFIPAADLKFIEKYTPDLQRIGVRCLYKPFVNDIAEYLRDNGKKFDLVMVYRVHCAAGNIAMIQRYCPDAKIIFDTVDLHYLREERRAKLESSDELLEQARITKNLELSIIQKSDATILLSPVEKELLLQEPGIDINKIFVIPLIRDIPGRSKGFGERKGILFIGGFQHAPNVDAMVFFLSNIWPLVKGSIPDLEFSIVGSKVPETIRKVCNSDVKLLGYVKDIEPLFSNCRVSVAPLRYGAGLKGKIATSLSYGVPCVATSIAVEGSGMKNKKEIYVADKPEAFAQAVVELHENEEIWNVISQQGLEYVQKHYSIEAGRKKIGHLLKSIRM
jgi:glycosyltransferase involved in cell wall biosynthesis